MDDAEEVERLAGRRGHLDLERVALVVPGDAGVAGLVEVGGSFWPSPFSTNSNFGGLLLFGSAPCASPSLLHTGQLNDVGRSFFFTMLTVCGPSSG